MSPTAWYEIHFTPNTVSPKNGEDPVLDGPGITTRDEAYHSMGGVAGKSGPPGNQNAFRHGLAGISQRRNNGTLNPSEHSLREEILSGLRADKGGQAQMRILAEVIASDAASLAAFNKATDALMEKNEKARSNPAALAKLDGYKRGLVNSL